MSDEDPPVWETDDAAHDHDYRAEPTAYRVGDGEEGAFKIQPYKSELLPLWTIADLEAAREAAAAIHDRFEAYRTAGEFVGMDMARKYLQMGWTRSLRYAKYPGGRKYDDDGTERDAQRWYDEEKYEISQVYREHLDTVEADADYVAERERWRERHG